jgi:hypothetical protein
MLPCGTFYNVLIELVVVGRVQQCVEPIVDLRLTCGAYFVVGFLYLKPSLEKI